ncbi:TolC family protein [Granulicella rosea]|uniref:TolC family protein n=1 Tax=Granulicella rosea TaxID=474952 RepID=UPI001FE70B6B|nr:TolC family protein [Granulicella rosea]
MRLNDLKSAASVALLLMSATAPQGFAQQTQVSPTAPSTAAPGDNAGLPPEPKATEPLYLRDTAKDYTHLKGYKFLNLIAPYTSTQVPLPTIQNTPRLATLLRDGTIYLGLTDAITLALENNYDIAIARINLDIADTDILRARAGSSLRGVSTGLVENTLGGTTTTITSGGGPGGTSTSSGGSGTGTSGLVLSTNGGGPAPYNFDPQLTSTVEFERATTQSSSSVSPTATVNTVTANVAYQQGFSSGTLLNVGFNNTRAATTSVLATYTPSITTTLRATATQHLLQGFGTGLNRRFIVEAINDRRITDSSFRQQVIYTVTQVESIYWSLVSAYEDEQAKERALQQSTQLASDNRKQLEIGTLAPLDVVNSDSAVATDRQALITSKSNLEYQQLLMKQAIARDLSESLIANAPVVPTDRIGLDRTPEEDMKVEDLVRLSYVNNPQIEQALLTMKNNEITIRGEKNGLLPTVDAFAFYGTNALGGTVNGSAVNLGTGSANNTASTPTGYGGVLQNLLSANNPDYGAGVNITIPIRNRTAQADQARSQMEYRQTQMRLQQLYTQIRIQVINAQYALTNDRANVEAAQAARDYGAQSLDAEQKKYKLGASTTANVLQQERNLATAENTLISATAAYAKDRSALSQIVSNTLDRYGISLVDAAAGTMTQMPFVPGLTAPKPPAPPKPLSATP